ncbi:MAG: glycoside hydrolase domain-containing protein [Planctomycetota bacterium]|jgi:hypothetical protein
MKRLMIGVLLWMACFGQLGWAAEPGVLWPSDGLSKVLRTAKPSADAGVLEFCGARGEIVSTQAVFRIGKDVTEAEVDISDLRHVVKEAFITSKSIRLQWVRYIDLSENTKHIPADELVAKAPTSIPDTFWEDTVIKMAAGQAQPIWIEVEIPRSVPAGDYGGVLSVSCGSRKVVLPVKLHVWDFEVPEERHLSVVNWWQFPGRGFAERVKAYSPEYWRLLGEFCKFLVKYRQTDINTSIGLIQEKGDGHDTSLLERYADIAFEAGIRQIHLHSVGRRSGQRMNPGSFIKANEAKMRRLAALEKVIQKGKFKGKFVVSISDEPVIYHEESYAQVVDEVHKVAPSIRCVEAVETEYMGKLDIWVPKLIHLNLWYPRFDAARRGGAELWFYTCCDPKGRYPNRFLDQSLLKVRVLHWINYLYDMDGYLHWGLNQFAGGDPYSEKAIGGRWPAGDRAIVYPGKEGLVGSLRFSAQRDGLEDYEYLWVLENELRKIKDGLGDEAFWFDPRQRPLELCRRVVRSCYDYTRDRQVMLDTRRAIAEENEALQRGPLLVVQTSPPEGTAVPAEPRIINIRGLVPPGANVSVNGQPVKSVRPSGYFLLTRFLHDGHPTVTVEVEHKGKKRTATRTFNLVD